MLVVLALASVAADSQPTLPSTTTDSEPSEPADGGVDSCSADEDETSCGETADGQLYSQEVHNTVRHYPTSLTFYGSQINIKRSFTCHITG